jgi:serine/threonine-protein kinase
MPFEIGQIAADYEILGLLGKGGMGRVYRVRNVISNRVEAMKVLLADISAEADLGDRFIGEIRTLARLDHPNIAKFHTAFKFENQLVMLMELVEGSTLGERAKEGPVPLDELLSYTTQTLAALSYAHQNGVIHRDIKPSNIMVTPHGVVKLMDFGIAKSTFEPLLTRPGTTMGSMLYMSPEQVRGTTVDARSDIYSVGVLLYELTAGRRPFEAENTYAILEAQLNTTPRPPLELNPALPKPLNDIIMTALAKEPMQRFQTADAFRNALESVRGRAAAPQAKAQPSGQTVTQPIPPPGIPPAASPRRRGLWMALGAVACVCVIAGGAVLLPHFWKSSAHEGSAPAAKPDAPAQALSTSASQQAAMNPEPAANSRPATANSASVTQPATPSPEPAPTQVPRSSPGPEQKRVARVSQEARVPGSGAVQGAYPQISSAPPSSPPAQQAQPQAQPAALPAGPSQADLDKASEDLMKLHARADAVKDSLDRLRGQNAASGLGVRQDIVASASRMESYLQAADRALQSNTLDSARKDMTRAEEELNKLEAFFGR